MIIETSVLAIRNGCLIFEPPTMSINLFIYGEIIG